jgi:hypothetical protein
LLIDSHDLGNRTCTCNLGGKLGRKLCFLQRAGEPISLDLLEGIEQLLMHLDQ